MGKYPYPPTDSGVEPATLTEFQERSSDGQETGRTFLYLKSEDRIAWYHRYCAFHDILPCIDTELARERKPEPDGSYSEVFKASVFFDGKLVATGHGSEKAVNLDPKIRLIETAETYAIGRALKHAGFMLESEPPDKGDGDGQCGFAVAPIQNPGSYAPVQPSKPAAAQTLSQQPPGQTSPAVMPAAGITDPDVLEAMRPDPPATIQEAMALKFPMGQNKGRMLGEINAINRSFVAWVAGLNPERPFKSASNYPRLVAAAKMIVGAK